MLTGSAVAHRSLHGAALRTGVLAGLTLTETAYPSGLRLPPHSHDASYLCLVLTGSFTESSPQTAHTCAPGTVILHPPGDRHADVFHAAARCFNVVFGPAWAARMADGRAFRRSAVDTGHAAHMAARIYREFRATDEASPLIVEGLALELIGHDLRSTQKRGRIPPGWLVAARELLHDRFRDRIALSDVAGAVGVHATHLAREFRRHYGRSVGEYLRELRLDCAKRQLAHTTLALSAIAQESGFFDQSHLARKFRHATGMSPSAYRRLMRAR